MNEKIKELETELQEANESINWWTNRFKAVEKENQKLNKIIDELEKTIEDFITNHTEQYLNWKYDEKIYNAETNVLSKLHDKIFDKLTELKKEVE